MNVTSFSHRIVFSTLDIIRQCLESAWLKRCFLPLFYIPLQKFITLVRSHRKNADSWKSGKKKCWKWNFSPNVNREIIYGNWIFHRNRFFLFFSSKMHRHSEKSWMAVWVTVKASRKIYCEMCEKCYTMLKYMDCCLHHKNMQFQCEQLK